MKAFEPGPEESPGFDYWMQFDATDWHAVQAAAFARKSVRLRTYLEPFEFDEDILDWEAGAAFVCTDEYVDELIKLLVEYAERTPLALVDTRPGRHELRRQCGEYALRLSMVIVEETTVVRECRDMDDVVARLLKT